MRRNPKRLAFAAAGAITVCFLFPMTAGTLSAAALQNAAGGGISAAAQQWTDDGRRYKVTTETDPLNMRADADASAPIITMIPRGTVVTVLQTRSGWGRVQYGSETGYCAMAWLTLVQDAAPAVPAAPTAENDPVKNERRIFQYLTETLGLTPAAACGIIGNIHAETGGSFDPTANNLDAPEGPYGYGLCQWNSGANAGYRMEELQAFSPEWQTLECQLDFIRNDLLNNNYLISLHLYDDLKALGNTEADAVTAADRWAICYEGCAEWTYEIRREKARFYFAEHCGNAVQWKTDGRTYYIATESGGLNMRATASMLGTIVTALPKDAAVTVKSVSDDGKWAEVVYQGTSGFCAMEYLKLADSAQSGTMLLGDLNGNGAVGADDAQIALTAYTNRITGREMNLTAAQIKAADIDEDGLLGAGDPQMILTYYTVKYVSSGYITWEQLRNK